MRAHVRQIKFGDIHHHSVKPFLGILRRKILVFMFVIGHEIYLSNFPCNNPMVGLREGSHFKTPVVGKIHSPCDSRRKTEFPRKRVFKTSMVIKKSLELMISPFVHNGSSGHQQKASQISWSPCPSLPFPSEKCGHKNPCRTQSHCWDSRWAQSVFQGESCCR